MNEGENNPNEGYHGPTVDPVEFLNRVEVAAQRFGWKLEKGEAQFLPIYYLRRGPRTGRSIYLSGGIHGDEPASAEAVLEMMGWKDWPQDYQVHLFPLLNPFGLSKGSRYDQEGRDLNRDYRQQTSEIIRYQIQILEGLKNRIGLAISLHEDWEAKGFYLYELPNQGSRGLGRRALDQLKTTFPLDTSSFIDGHEAHSGLIHPSDDFPQRPQWPETAYLMAECGCTHGYTLEAPSLNPMEFRIQGLLRGCHALISEWLAEEMIRI